MIRFLLSISILLFSSLCYSQALKVDGKSSYKYKMNITFSKANISGICILRDNGEQIVGSVINEFGIKAFDFVYDKKRDKTKLANVMKLFNKWFIKRVLSSDLSCLLRVDNTKRKLKKRKLCFDNNETVTLENCRYNIIYNFKLINETIE